MNPLLPAFVRPPPVATNINANNNSGGSGASPPFGSVDLSLGSSVRNSHHSHVGGNASTMSPKSSRNSQSPFLQAAGGSSGPTADQAAPFGSRYVLCQIILESRQEHLKYVQMLIAFIYFIV